MLKQKKILLASAIMVSLSGFTAGAAVSPELAASGSGMSQSSMVNVNNGKSEKIHLCFLRMPHHF